MPESRDGQAGPVHASGELISLATILNRIDDVMANRLGVMGTRNGSATFALTPSFFLDYSGLMKGDVIVFEACHSLSSPKLSRAFGSLCVDAVAGFTKTTRTAFATAPSLWSITWPPAAPTARFPATATSRKT